MNTAVNYPQLKLPLKIPVRPVWAIKNIYRSVRNVRFIGCVISIRQLTDRTFLFRRLQKKDYSPIDYFNGVHETTAFSISFVKMTTKCDISVNRGNEPNLKKVGTTRGFGGFPARLNSRSGGRDISARKWNIFNGFRLNLDVRRIKINNKLTLFSLHQSMFHHAFFTPLHYICVPFSKKERAFHKKMNNYETTIILTPVLSDDEVKQSISSYIAFLKENGAEIVHEDHWGLKQLAYPIAKKTTGVYHWVEYKGPGDIVAKLEVQFGRDDKLLRFLTVRLDKFAIDYNERKRNGLIGRKNYKPEVKASAEKKETADAQVKQEGA